MKSPIFVRFRFAFKLSFAIVLSLLLGFHLQLATPRWSVLTAAIVSSVPAFAAGGEPFSGAIRHRGMLRIIGTFIGCFGALVIIIMTIRAPVVMLMLCCLWAGVCTWLASLVKVENAYVFGLAGYTSLIIIVSIQETPLLTPQFAVERCSEIVLGIVCVILADLAFSPRSIKEEVDRGVEALLVDQYRLLQLCINQAEREAIDAAWHGLVRKTAALDGMRTHLMMESSRWQNGSRRLKAMHTQSLALITQSCETYLILQDHASWVKGSLKWIIDQPVESMRDVHQRLKTLRYLIAASHSRAIPPTVSSWVGTATRYQLLAKGVRTNGRISKVEADVLSSDVEVKAPSAETHHAMINGLRTGVATAVGCLFWLATGWTSGSVCMVMIAVVTSLAMRLPNPKMMAIDFLYGTIFALPLGALMFMVIMPATQQSMLLLCLSLGAMAFFIGIEVQKRRLGSLGALASTINILVLDNPMTFDISQFLDSAIGQIIGCFLALLVILLIRDNAKARTGRTLLNRFVYSAVSALTTNQARRKKNHLPALYQQLFLLLNMFPGDIAKYRLALSLIIAHQRLHSLDIPQDEALSSFHRQLRATAQQVVDARRGITRSRSFAQLLDELGEYRRELADRRLPPGITAPVGRLIAMLHKYQHALSD
ncbi:p-hydroxybenzoic acid efflux pump subunit AaeB [Brenneria tiliae]|uniref:p-hydroxybenzoic acid efflux pump subunit AaeB n=1 Tax=Brenneria tiliae TaxID=2914984 RepID=UPI002014F634|nr:p-hydroxybenzoic acid efflux pump subunit AaeB [Brenneria tiliae]MCL2898118.1 p-hydroxybenzoic acid efflux pump subunit AaeB [Brenneria tiliae]MCL2902199.1 p-hydroxybenzoic acid efflux pump subunit AaeB [Brenneria tiliae]